MTALEQPDAWQDRDKAQSLGQERAELEEQLHLYDKLTVQLEDSEALLALAVEEADPELLQQVETDITELNTILNRLEFERMFSGKMDKHDAFIEINSGSGGTEAQDWAEMLLRMYLRWCERHAFKTEIIEASPGEVAGLKSATVKVQGAYAFGWLRTESGVHRLVRKSPFDANSKRHTSFASVFISPIVDEDIDIEINPADLRIDTYRASGAGGQHVNRTDSAVRITHVPTNVVVQCQSDRSQHRNRATAMAQLRAKLYVVEMQKRQSEKQSLEESKAEIGWGSQIRSYVLDQSRIKDLRTNVEVGSPQKVLDGDLDIFIEAMLKQGESHE